MQLNIKKPNEHELKQVLPVSRIRSTINGDGILVDCPKCKAVHFYNDEWPIDKVLICNATVANGICGGKFIIKNDTPIED